MVALHTRCVQPAGARLAPASRGSGGNRLAGGRSRLRQDEHAGELRGSDLYAPRFELLDQGLAFGVAQHALRGSRAPPGGRSRSPPWLAGGAAQEDVPRCYRASAGLRLHQVRHGRLLPRDPLWGGFPRYARPGALRQLAAAAGQRPPGPAAEGRFHRQSAQDRQAADHGGRGSRAPDCARHVAAQRAARAARRRPARAGRLERRRGACVVIGFCEVCESRAGEGVAALAAGEVRACAAVSSWSRPSNWWLRATGRS